MAVHGAAARMILPAMYWSASPGEIHGLKAYRKKAHANHRHRERLHEPVHEQRHEQARAAPDVRIDPKSTFIIIA